MINEDVYTGCFYGLALGDALCAPYEGGILERLLWKVIGKTSTGETRYTDDTQMSLDVAQSLLEQGEIDQNHIAYLFASNYRWSRGYGLGAAKMLKKIRKGATWQDVNCSVFPQGSYGNGAAMRAPIVALYFYGNERKMLSAVQEVSEITHCHPLAIEGAQLIALAVSYSLSQTNPDSWFNDLLNNSESTEYQSRIKIATKWINSHQQIAPKIIRKRLGNGVAAINSCITAIYIAIRFINQPFLSMLDFIQKCSGDPDTIAAMAGSIWGAYNGSTHLTQATLNLESRVKILQLSIDLYHQATQLKLVETS